LNWEAYNGLDLRERIVVLLEGNAPADFPTEALIRGAEGVLWLTANDEARSQTQFAFSDRDYMRSPQLPIVHVDKETAVSILNNFKITQSELLTTIERTQSGDGWFTRDLDGATMRMAVELEEPRETAVPTVLGYLSGSDLSLASELVIIYAHFDGLGTDPNGTVYPAANHDASGVGVMLEVARLWQDESLDPRRPVLFVAWGAGSLDAPGAREFIDEEQSFFHLPTTERLRPRAVFQLDNAGAGSDQLLIHPASNDILTELVSESAAEVGVALLDDGETAVSSDMLDPTAPWVHLSWENEPIPPDQDTFARIDSEKLRTFGEVLALSLAKIVRQSRY